MPRVFKIFPLLALIALVLALAIDGARAGGAVISVWFAPGDDCETAIVEQLDQATKSIHYQMYNFTAVPIAEALTRAASRGVEVVILLDHGASLQPKCQGQACAKAGCQVFIDWSHPIAHNKIRIVDGRLTLGGSYNDSAQAHKNAENLTLDDDQDLAGRFEANFQAHLAHSKTLKKSHADDLAHERAKAAKKTK